MWVSDDHRVDWTLQNWKIMSFCFVYSNVNMNEKLVLSPWDSETAYKTFFAK